MVLVQTGAVNPGRCQRSGRKEVERPAFLGIDGIVLLVVVVVVVVGVGCGGR
jgi:hypothetical protein